MPDIQSQLRIDYYLSIWARMWTDCKRFARRCKICATNDKHEAIGSLSLAVDVCVLSITSFVFRFVRSIADCWLRYIYEYDLHEHRSLGVRCTMYYFRFNCDISSMYVRSINTVKVHRVVWRCLIGWPVTTATALRVCTVIIFTLGCLHDHFFARTMNPRYNYHTGSCNIQHDYWDHSATTEL